MSLIISDTHGNYHKIKYFLEYKPEEEHIFAGDILDSFHAEDEVLLQCFLTLVNSECVLLWGNHDLHYLKNAPFRCTGFRNFGADLGYGNIANEFTFAVEKYKSRFRASCTRDGFIITHAGVHPGISKYLDNIDQVNEYCNNEITDYFNRIDKGNGFYKIFNISYARGGGADFGGIFWADYKQESLDKRFNQIFGHTSSREPKIVTKKSKGDRSALHVCTDTPRFFCFNTKTKEFEYFFPKERKDEKEFLERPF